MIKNYFALNMTACDVCPRVVEVSVGMLVCVGMNRFRSG